MAKKYKFEVRTSEFNWGLGNTAQEALVNANYPTKKKHKVTARCRIGEGIYWKNDEDGLVADSWGGIIEVPEGATLSAAINFINKKIREGK